MVWPQLERSLVVCDRLLGLSLEVVDGAEIGPGIGVGRLAAQGLFEACSGLGKPALPDQHRSQQIVNAGAMGHESHGPAQAVLGLGRLAQGMANDTQQTPAIAVRRLRLDELLAQLLGLGRPARLMMFPGLVK